MWLRTIVKRRARWLPPVAVLVVFIVGLGFGIRSYLIAIRDPLANLQWGNPPTGDSTPTSVTSPTHALTSAPNHAPDSAPAVAADVPGAVSSPQQASQQAYLQPSRSDPQYTVQLGAFLKEARAGRLARAATQAGFASSVIKGSTATRGTVFRVQLDGVFEKTSAEQLSVEVRKRVPGVDPIVVGQHH